MKNYIFNSKRVATVVLSVAMMASIGLFSPSQSYAQTDQQLAALQAQIAKLQAQIAALTQQGALQFTHTFTRNLTVGSTGEEVRQLQIFLNQDPDTRLGVFGPGSAGQETSYFGPRTRDAVLRFQATYATDVLTPLGLSQPTGFWGPSSRAKANALIQERQQEPQPGDDGDDTGDGDEGELEGGAGSLNDVDFMSGLNNEEVGEGERDARIAGLRIEADDGSDIKITAVRLNFDQGTADDDFDDYAEDVSIWFNGTKLAKVDADRFHDDNDYARSISLDRGAVVRAGDRGELVVKVSGISNLDSADAGDTWTVIFENIRFRDAQNAIITDSTTGDLGQSRTFSFETFATAADAEFRVRLSDNNPKSQPVNVDTSKDTDGVELLRFTLEAKGDSDLRVRDLPITLTITGATDIDNIVNTLHVEFDGEGYSENVSTNNATSATITFEDLDETIKAGDEVVVIVRADINDLGSGFSDGDTLIASYASANRAATDIEDESGEDLAASDRIGTAIGEAMIFYDEGIIVELVSISQSALTQSGSGNDTAQFQIKYTITAFDSDIYVSDSPIATTAAEIDATTVSSDSVFYRVDKSGSAVTSGVSAVASFVSDGNRVTNSGVTNGVKIKEGSTGRFTLSITRTNSVSADSGQYRAALKGISWATTDTSTQNVYDFDLDEYETAYVFIN